MSEIVVELREPSEQGRLYYHRDPQIEGDILYIQNLKHQQSIYTVCIGGSPVVIDFNIERVLMDVEFIYRWKYWNKSSDLKAPQPVREADLTFVGVKSEDGGWEAPAGIRITSDTIERHSFQYDPVITATTDAGYSFVRFLFDSTEPIGEWVTLSHQCLALVDGNYLRGFFIHLKDAPLRQYRNRSTK